MKARLAKWIADVVCHIPRPFNEPLALLLGGLLFLSYERHVALANLATAFPTWSRWRRLRIAAAAYRQMARTLVEFLHTRDYGNADIRRRVVIENQALLDAAHAEGRGVILLSGHYGNWEWLGRRVTAAGFPFAALYKKPKDAGFGARLRAMREAAGLVQIDHDDMRGAIQWLRRGGVLGIIMDQEPHKSKDGAVTPLFGRPTATYIGPFRLARLVGAPVFTIFCRRVGSAHYRGRLEPLPLSAHDDIDRAMAADAAVFNARLETAVRAAPSHWLWMYRRWGRLKRRQSAQRSEAATG